MPYWTAWNRHIFRSHYSKEWHSSIQVYEKAALRPMTDMDLLVPFHDMERAGQIILSAGYEYFAPPAPYWYSVEVAFQKMGKVNFYVDLHFSILNSVNRLTPQQLEWYLHHRIPVESKYGHTVWALDPMAQFLHLVAHLKMTYGSEDLIRWYDVYRLVQENLANLDWEQLLDVGKEFGNSYFPCKRYYRNSGKNGEFQFQIPSLPK